MSQSQSLIPAPAPGATVPDVARHYTDRAREWFAGVVDALDAGDLDVDAFVREAGTLGLGLDVTRMAVKFAAGLVSLREYPRDDRGRYYGNQTLETMAEAAGINVRDLREARRAAEYEVFATDGLGNERTEAERMESFLAWVLEPTRTGKRPRSWSALQRLIGVGAGRDRDVHPPEARERALASKIEEGTHAMAQLVEDDELDPDLRDGVHSAGVRAVKDIAGRGLGVRQPAQPAHPPAARGDEDEPHPNGEALVEDAVVIEEQPAVEDLLAGAIDGDDPDSVYKAFLTGRPCDVTGSKSGGVRAYQLYQGDLFDLATTWSNVSVCEVVLRAIERNGLDRTLRTYETSRAALIGKALYEFMSQTPLQTDDA